MKTKKGQFIIILFVLVSVPVFLSLKTPPDEFYIAGIIALTIPFFIVLDLGVLIFFIIRRSPWSFVPLFSLAFLLPMIPDVFSFSSSNDTLDRDKFSIMSYNVNALGYYHDSLNFDVNKNSFERWVQNNEIDILCLQEMALPKLDSFSIEGFTKRSSLKRTRNGDRLGLFIFSKFPIVNDGEIEFAYNSFNRLMWVDVVSETDTIRIINVHLMSYDLGSNIFENVRKVKNGLMARSWHSKLMYAFIVESPYPVILCGDLNETPLSFPYQNLRKQLSDSFTSSEKVFPYTYSFLMLPIRIDHVLLSPTLKNLHYAVVKDATWSDHQPVLVHIELPVVN